MAISDDELFEVATFLYELEEQFDQNKERAACAPLKANWLTSWRAIEAANP